MAIKPLPPASHLKQWLDYDPMTGVFVWKRQPDASFSHCTRDATWVAKIWNANNAGKRAFGPCQHGYWSGHVCGARVYAHRAAVAIMTGEWPNGQVDHINGTRSDNRWANLRVVDQSGNNRNSAMQRNNTSGFVGVSRDRGKWSAHIYGDKRKRIFLGRFSDIADAVAARKNAEDQYAYHPNHGRALRDQRVRRSTARA
jgi:hypothetical protein